MTGDASRPLVSVVMPFKDAVAFLEQAARSALAQTWPRVELVLVDDGGSDGSVQVAERLQAADPDRVRLVAHAGRANRGIGASRRLGLATAKGELVANLDADDAWEPGHLEHEVGLLLRTGADLVHGRAWTWFSWAGDGRDDVLYPPPFAPGVVVPGQELLTAVLRDGGFAAPPCSVLARASLLGDWTEDLDDFPGMYEDQVLHSGLQLRGRAVISGSTTAWYRQHQRSISAQELLPDAASRFDRGRHEFLQWLDRQPLLDDPVARAQLARNQRERQQRFEQAARAGGVRAAAGRLPASVRRRGRSARGAVSEVVRSAERAHEAIRPGETRTARATAAAHAERMRQFFESQGADLRGRVLVLGEAAEVPAEVRAAATDQRPLPAVAPPGPLHPLAALPERGYDCVAVVDDGAAGRWGAADLRHLRRCLDLGGVLLLALRRPLPAVEAGLREAFDADLVRSYWHPLPGPGRHPMQAVRAAVRV